MSELPQREASAPGVHLPRILESPSSTVHTSCLVKTPRGEGSFSWERRWVPEVRLKLGHSQWLSLS